MVSCIQFVALMVFIISNIRDIASPLVYGAIFNVATSILIFLVALPITGRLRKSPAFVAAHHKTVNTVAVLYCVIFLIWGMVASARVYMMGRQVMSTTVSGTQTTTMLPDVTAGVYVLRLIDKTNGTRTQKIVIE